MNAIATDTRWYDFIIDDALVMDFDREELVQIAGAAVEAKAATTNKGEFVAELIRDMYNVLKGAKYSGQKALSKVVVVYPDDPEVRDWVINTVKTVSQEFNSVFGTQNAGGALGSESLVEFASETSFKRWLGAKSARREIERLIELAEAGFEGPEMEGFFDRYIDEFALAVGWYEVRLVADLDWSEEELRALLALGVGEPVWAPDGSLDMLKIKVRGASELPAEVRERIRRVHEPRLLRALKEVAGLLAIARYAKVGTFIFCYW